MLVRADAEDMFEFSLRRMQKESAPADGDTRINCKVLSKNPVVITTGEKYKYENDFETTNTSGLDLSRIYRSKNAVGALFGPHWMSNIDYPKLSLTSRFTNWAQVAMN